MIPVAHASVVYTVTLLGDRFVHRVGTTFNVFFGTRLDPYAIVGMGLLLATMYFSAREFLRR